LKLPPQDPVETKTGTIEHVIFHAPDTGYTVAAFQPDDELLGITITGNMPSLDVGVTVEITGCWVTHKRYGRQFQVRNLRFTLPSTLEGLEAHLASGLIKGVGPELARRIVAHFGLTTPQIIARYPERLREVNGIGVKRTSTIAASWEEQEAINRIMVFLRGLGIGPATAMTIYKRYEGGTIEQVRQAPYQLIYDIRGIGFIKADEIARSLGFPLDSLDRVQAGIYHMLQESLSSGHVYLPWEDLVQKARRLVGVEQEGVEAGIEELQRRHEVRIEEELLVAGLPSVAMAQRAVYLQRLYRDEAGVASCLHGLATCPHDRLAFPKPADWDTLLQQVHLVDGDDVDLTQEQRLAVQQALTAKVTVLTGGPGTGKTSAIRTVIALLEAAGYNSEDYALTAPTGRAAKRLNELTGRPACTIHRLLEVKPGVAGGGFYFTRNEEAPLPASLVIVDETSMVDISLFHHLLRAIRPGSHLLLVGDVDQLPPVGPGNPLRDVIGSGVATVVRLVTIHRQAEGSHIVSNAHRIRQGQMPVLQKAADFFFVPCDGQEDAAQEIVTLVRDRLPAHFGLRREEIQVLSPMHRGAAGVAELNRRLQEALNPASPGVAQLTVGDRIFRSGDRVMQVRNDYRKEVYNGDIGYVVAVHPKESTIEVSINSVVHVYDLQEIRLDLKHAFASTIHKSQGSEYPVVVMALMSAHYVLLQRNLLYTGITRAQQVVVIVGQKKALGMAIRNNKVAKRYSALAERLVARRASAHRGGKARAGGRATSAACPCSEVAPAPRFPHLGYTGGRQRGRMP